MTSNLPNGLFEKWNDFFRLVEIKTPLRDLIKQFGVTETVEIETDHVQMLRDYIQSNVSVLREIPSNHGLFAQNIVSRLRNCEMQFGIDSRATCWVRNDLEKLRQMVSSTDLLKVIIALTELHKLIESKMHLFNNLREEMERRTDTQKKQE